MTTPRPFPRQSPRIDEAAPVLFRLPNLRSRGTAPVLNVQTTASVDRQPPQTQRISAAQPREPFLTPPTVEQKSVPVTVATTVPTTAAAPSPATSAETIGRSWMERIGSRLILIVTLLVIVSAVWVTSGRMPAPRLGEPSHQPIAQAPDLDIDMGTVVQDFPAPKPAPEPAARLTAIITPPTPTATATQTQVGPNSFAAKTSSAPAEATTTTPDPMSLAALNAAEETPYADIDLLPPSVEATKKDNVGINTTLSLDPPSTSSPRESLQASKPNMDSALLPPRSDEFASAPATELPFYTADESFSSSSLKAQPVSVQTRTQDDVKHGISPATSLKGPQENRQMSKHFQTSTPSPVRDWSAYLPTSTAPFTPNNSTR